MDLIPLLLVLLGSLLHVGWNAFAKGSKDKLAFLWLSLLLPSVLGGIYLLYHSHLFEALPGITWFCLYASVLVHCIYAALLASAYHYADLSFVYPYSRGIGSACATLLGVLILSENPSTIGWLGIGLTIGATFVEAVFSRKLKGSTLKGVLLTGFTGVSISLYLVIDKIGLYYLSPIAYLSALFMGMVLLMTPLMLVRSRALHEVLFSGPRVLYAGFFMTTGYGVVLVAMASAPVTYVVAARATGIVASAAAGRFFFKEKIYSQRWAAIAMIALGVILIGLA